MYSIYDRDNNRRNQQLPSGAAAVQPPVDQPQQQEIPQVDTTNALNSIANLIGPSPAEREAQQQKLLKQKRTMLAWTGLFDGLRQLANLYSVSRGANNMQFTDNPYQTVEKGYQAELKRQDANQSYANAYAKQMVDYKRQAQQDKMSQERHKAQMDWYDTREEMARMKAENDKLKAEQQKSINDARLKQIQTKTKQMEDLYPLQRKRLEAMIANTFHNANRPYSGGRSGKGSSSVDPFEELANLLYDNPDIIGPILEKEGFGYYNADTKDFDFRKNVTKGMAKTANQQANRQINQKGLRSAKSKVSIR